MNSNSSTVIANRVYFGYFWPIFIDAIFVSTFFVLAIILKDIVPVLFIIPFLSHGFIVTSLRVKNNKKDRIMITYKDDVYTIKDNYNLNLKQKDIYAVVGKNKIKRIFTTKFWLTSECNYGKLIIYCSYGKIKLKNVYTPDLVAYEMQKYIINN